MTDRDQLHHLADRARRGALLPAEGALLADAVDVLLADLDRYEEVVVGELNEANIGLQRQAAQVEAERDMLGRETDRLRKDWVEMRDRAEQAEANIAGVREAHRADCLIARGRNAHGCACPTCEALDAVPDPGTVTITQTRHQHLVAGQCIHHQEIHRLHHTEPVTGCPYPGCHPDA